MIAAVIGIAVALTFVVRSLGGTPIQAQSGGSGTAAVAAAPSAPPSELLAAEARSAPLTADQAGPDSGFGAAEGLPLSDPFRPIKADHIQGPAPAAPADRASRPAPQASDARPVRIASAPALPDIRPAVAVMSLPAETEPRPSRPAGVPAARPAGEPAVSMLLVGTVGEDPSGVAILRGGERSTFARVGEVVAGWRITGVRMGRVSLKRAAVRRLVRVGDDLPGQAPSIKVAAAPGA